MAAAACQPKKAAPTPQEPEPSAQANPDGLPPFDVSEPEPAVSEGGVPHERFFVELGDAPTRGPTTAPVTIVMFSDFECPYCQKGHGMLEQLFTDYRGQVRIAYKAYPLDTHGGALVAAMAARSAQKQGKFWPFHDMLFSQRGLDWPTLIGYAEAVGLDVDRMRKDVDSLEYGPEVRRDMRQGRKLGVRSTPTFFVNGRHVRGAQPIGVFRSMIEEEIELADTWRKDKGVAPQDVYAHAIAEGYRKVEYTERGRVLDQDAVFKVPVGDSPTQGPADAPITLVTFGDFECPFCARGFQTVEEVKKAYAGRIRLVYKHLPLSFHSHAFLAARASMAAHAQGKFWAFHDALYARGGRFGEDDLYAIARKVRLNMKKFRQAMESTELDSLVAKDQALAASMGVSGTPAYFINGRPLEGAMPELHFRLLIEEELDRVAKLKAEGVAPAQLYDALITRDIDGRPQ